MKPQIGKPCRRVVLLVLAFSASVMQVLGFSLPSQVVCQRADRPPRLEFFSDSCSCRHEEIPSCFDQNAHGVPCFGHACTDIHLKSPALLSASVCWNHTSVRGERCSPGVEPSLSEFAFFSLRPGPDDRGVSRAESPPPLSHLSVNSRLRC
ncbi:MAG TPA: hypothetical protein VMZ49_06560 [Patescibacteria group bacterium]|nr:hypothetical protein [Patescibacteria group bacterium]